MSRTEQNACAVAFPGDTIKIVRPLTEAEREVYQSSDPSGFFGLHPTALGREFIVSKRYKSSASNQWHYKVFSKDHPDSTFYVPIPMVEVVGYADDAKWGDTCD